MCVEKEDLKVKNNHVNVKIYMKFNTILGFLYLKSKGVSKSTFDCMVYCAMVQVQHRVWNEKAFGLFHGVLTGRTAHPDRLQLGGSLPNNKNITGMM